MRAFHWIVFGAVFLFVQVCRANERTVLAAPNFADGVRYWESGDYMAARNEWYRCVVLTEYQMENSLRCEPEAAEESLTEAEWELEMRDRTVRPIKHRSRVKANYKKPKQTKSNLPDSKKMARYARHFEVEARQAKARGQLDAALRLFRTAQRIEPGSVEIEKEIKRLEEDVN